MELGIIGLGLLGSSAVAYLSNQKNRINNFKETNSKSIKGNLPYPQLYQTQYQGQPPVPVLEWNNLRGPVQTKEHYGNIPTGPINNQTNDLYNSMLQQPPVPPNVITGGQFENMNKFQPNQVQESKEMDKQLLDIKNRSQADFAHNFMVPNKIKFTQSMAGCNLESGNYNIDSTANNGSDFSTPYQSVLNTYTGVDDTYRYKRETGPMFSPAEVQQNFVFKTPVTRGDPDRYEVSLLKRNDLKPVEAQRVGPGLLTSVDIPAQGGLHDFTRVLPNNVSDYKANQLEGRINSGKFYASGLPSALPGIGTAEQGPVGVVSNKPPKFWSQDRRPTMTTKVGYVNEAETLRGDYNVDMRPKNATRDQQSYGYGQIKMVDPSATSGSNKQQALNNLPNQIEYFANESNGGNKVVPCIDMQPTIGINPSRPSMNINIRPTTFMSQDNNVRSRADCNSVPIIGPSVVNRGKGPLAENFYVNETDRGTVAYENVNPLNLKGPNAGTFYTYVDKMNTTMKETTEYSYTSNPHDTKKGSTFYTYNDLPNVSLKETLEFSYVNNPSETKKGSTFYTFIDKPNCTTKETTEFSYVGDPNNEKKGQTFYTFVDKPKPSLKAGTNYSYTGNADGAGGVFSQMSRFQFTGPEVSLEKFANLSEGGNVSIKNASGGADMYTIKGSTLVKDWTAPAGRMNITLDPDIAIGKFKTRKVDNTANGPNTLLQSIPDASKYSINRFMAKPQVKPNKQFGIDNRSIAPYLNQQLKNNPLSIFTNNPNSEIPGFFADSKPSTFADITANYEPFELTTGYSDPSSPVYPIGDNPLNTGKDNKDNVNPNAQVVYNGENNIMLDMSTNKMNNPITYPGLAYSGKYVSNELKRTDSGNIFVIGDNEVFRPRNSSDVGIENNNTNTVCENNYATSYSNHIMINRNLL